MIASMSSSTGTTLLLLLVPAAVHAQRPSKCGDLPELPDGAAEYVQVLTEPGYQWVRDANGLETLPPGTAGVLLADDHECSPVWRAVHTRVREVLPTTTEGRQARRDGFRFLIYRVGPYYVVPVQPSDRDGNLSEGYVIVNVFRVEDASFAGDWLG